MPGDFFLVSAARRLHRLKSDRGYVFGRDEKADIVIQDALISRRHAEMKWIAAGTAAGGATGAGAWEVRDLGSRNGVLVDGKKIAGPTKLRDGSRLQVGGQVYMVLHFPPGADPAAMAERAPQIDDNETMGPDFKVSDIVNRGANFVGEIGSEGVLDLLQYFASTGKSGRLDLTGGTNLAAVWFVNGAAVHAFMGAKLGMDALLGLARTPPKKFAFHAAAPPADQRSLQGSLQGLLMEVARVMDEEKKGKP
jgi:hypothetical protein